MHRRPPRHHLAQAGRPPPPEVQEVARPPEAPGEDGADKIYDYTMLYVYTILYSSNLHYII